MKFIQVIEHAHATTRIAHVRLSTIEIVMCPLAETSAGDDLWKIETTSYSLDVSEEDARRVLAALAGDSVDSMSDSELESEHAERERRYLAVVDEIRRRGLRG